VRDLLELPALCHRRSEPKRDDAVLQLLLADGADNEIYQPPYLTGTPPPLRPSGLIILNPSSTDPDGTFVLTRPGGAAQPGFNVQANNPADTVDFKLDRVVLITPGAVTHSSDMHQRFIECAVIQVTPTMLQFTAPSESHAPRGYYMMFVLTTAAIPSQALWVRLA